MAWLQVLSQIPSERNARFDAYSYALSSSEVVNWVFEFRARSKEYELSNAIEDLKEKCEATEAKSCHAMLIAYCATTESAACAWVEEVPISTQMSTRKSKSKLNLFRVAIVFGDA